MTKSSSEVPVHDSLEVREREDIYKNEEWWKSVVKYQHKDADSTETGVYLWHKEDDGWTRKNKYVIKTVEAWITDRKVINSLLQTDTEDETPEFPVSDYYSVRAGVTVFQSEGWWKAILNINQKGSYDTDEVMIYLWQRQDDDWRRRQKYTIKGEEKWDEEQSVIESVLNISSSDTESVMEGSTEISDESTSNDKGERVTSGSRLEMSEELADLDEELEVHLSETVD